MKKVEGDTSDNNSSGRDNRRRRRKKCGEGEASDGIGR